jgi:hypothetical protein
LVTGLYEERDYLYELIQLYANSKADSQLRR